MMVAIAILIGKGLESNKLISQLLDTETVKNKPMYLLASELPLVLVECGYADTLLHWRTDPGKNQTEEKIIQTFMRTWKEVSIKQTLLTGLIGNEYCKGEVTVNPIAKNYTPVMKLGKNKSVEETLQHLMSRPRKRYPFTIDGVDSKESE